MRRLQEQPQRPALQRMHLRFAPYNFKAASYHSENRIANGSSRVKKDWILTQEAFDNLMAWLSPDRERAAQKHEEIRHTLIRIFARRGCCVAEELVDETFNRVARRALDIAPTYEGDPALYFYRVAQYVYKEYLREIDRLDQLDWLPLAQPDPPEEKERYFDCLDRCIEQLDAGDRNLVLEYFHEEKRARIDHRKEMAERRGITLNALRTRAHRIKINLQHCIDKCLAQP